MRPLCTVLAYLFCSLHTATAAARPNIIVILSDDMGFSDIGCYGGEIETPHLDALAADGLRFTQFYNTARCCPTRASLLTGLYMHQAGIGHMMGPPDGSRTPGVPAPYQGDLNTRCLTLAEVLKPAGYRTYMAGKWHVTPVVTPKDESGKYNWPLQRGFDRFYGTIHGAGSFFDPNSLTRDNTLISPAADPDYQPQNGYFYTDAISDHAVRFLSDHAEAHSTSPFFMYVAYTAAHWPMHARDEDIAKYKGRYDQGYAPIRQARMAKLTKLGLIQPEWTMATQAEDWDAVEDKAFESRCMEVYAAMVDSMDQGIGRIVESLKANGQFENTLMLFMQDNGGCAEGMGRGKAGAERADAPAFPPMQAAELQFEMIPKQTRDGYPVRQGYGVMPGTADTYIGYGRGWANVSNTPFKEYKHWVHEGGIATPLIAHWPNGIAARGELRHQPSHLIDVMATCIDLSGADYPTQKDSHPIIPPEGRSLVAAFQNHTIDRDAIYWEHEGNRAVRDGQWKLVAKGPKGAWELYDMDSDRTESKDLAASHPERVATMASRWESWAVRVGATPWIWGPPHGPAKVSRKTKQKQ